MNVVHGVASVSTGLEPARVVDAAATFWAVSDTTETIMTSGRRI